MKKLWGIILMALLLSACDSVDCTLNNIVLCRYGFYNSSTGKSISLTDSLTVTAMGTDSVLYNKGVGQSSVSVPMSYWNDADTLLFTITGDGYSQQCSVTIGKTNTQHYESPDCPTTMFHLLNEATSNSPLIDSLVIVKPTVNYQQDENIKIYFHTAD